MTLQTEAFAQNPKLNDCIENCQRTQHEALRTLAWTTSEGFDNTTPEFVRLLADCAEICQTTANFMLRGSELHHETCRACAEVCAALADACDESGLEGIEDLREAARACAQSCKQMAQTTGPQMERSFSGRSGRGGREDSAQSGRSGAAGSTTPRSRTTTGRTGGR